MVSYGPPNWYVHFRGGAALDPGPVFSLFTGVDVPLYEKLGYNEQRLFVAALFGDIGIPFAAPFELGFDFGAYASLTPSLTGLAVGVMVNQDWLVLPFVSYTGAYYAGKKASQGESE
jgi:hypothetical protein